MIAHLMESSLGLTSPIVGFGLYVKYFPIVMLEMEEIVKMIGSG